MHDFLEKEVILLHILDVLAAVGLSISDTQKALGRDETI